MAYKQERRNLTRPVKKACHKASIDLNIPKPIVEEVIYRYYRMIADEIKKGDVMDDNTFHIFNIIGLGKLYPSKRKINYRRNKKQKENGGKTSNKN